MPVEPTPYLETDILVAVLHYDFERARLLMRPRAMGPIQRADLKLACEWIANELEGAKQ